MLSQSQRSFGLLISSSWLLQLDRSSSLSLSLSEPSAVHFPNFAATFDQLKNHDIKTACIINFHFTWQAYPGDAVRTQLPLRLIAFLQSLQSLPPVLPPELQDLHHCIHTLAKGNCDKSSAQHTSSSPLQISRPVTSNLYRIVPSQFMTTVFVMHLYYEGLLMNWWNTL